MSIDTLLSRLQKVRQTSSQTWTACCPAHEDRSPSLSIRDSSGTILLRCFAGCEVAEIVAAVGMELSDLFPPDAQAVKPMRKPFPAADVLECLSEESRIVFIIADRMSKGLPIADTDMTRLRTAVHRIEAAREIANG